ncbi:flagellar hook-length control protein FliK [uncultured Thiocystis sp.]|jgi:flagellar hook-length control protein FliK|uniref:flagellar hook-length control protein FliK n=1 Tax=uncultured Thiocystis sp. TaxID=1202134 RepID=UPI0025D44AA9|nr:flagellar hook-length control protein FliK [uncultured Thiocystis sp.]
MSESIPLALSRLINGSGPTGGAGVAETRASSTPLALKVGMQLELQLAQRLSSTLIEARLRPLEGNATWSATMRVQLTAPLPDLSARQAVSLTETRSMSVDAFRAKAEVLSISPTLTLRITPRTEQATASKVASPAAGLREWLGVQLRQNLPQSRSLTTTLQSWITRQKGPDGCPAPSSAEASPTIGTTQRTVEPTTTIGTTQRTVEPTTTIGATQRTVEPTTTIGTTQRMIETLVGRLTTTKDLVDPERLSSAIAQSGIWLEALMAQIASNPARACDRSLDLKAQLLRLAEQIRTADPSPSPSPAGPTPQAQTVAPARTSPHALPPASTEPDRANHPQRLPEPDPPQARSVAPEPHSASHRPHGETPHARPSAPDVLAKEVDGMIKHVVTQQLRSLEAGTDQPQWILELPFKTPSGLMALEADIRRENRGDPSEDDRWSMRIRLNLPRLGPLSINLSLRSDRLNAGLQAENETGANILRQHLETLRQQLVDRKIEVASLHASHRPGGSAQPARRPPMVSERA